MNEPVDLRLTSKFAESLFAKNHVGMAISDMKHFLFANDAFCSLFGYSQNELRQLNFRDLTFAEDLEESIRIRDGLIAESSSVITMEKRYVRKDGSVFPGRVGVMAFRDSSHNLQHTVITVEDISEIHRVTDALHESEKAKSQMQEQIFHTQKLESLGLIAGGIAHDFNNLLSAISANAEVIRVQSDEGSTIRIRSEQICRAVTRAASICRQMLEYSDKGKSAIVDINLSNLVIEIAELIKPSIPRDVQLNLECDQDVPMIRGDEGMISQVILNFLTNAADAMQDRAGSICVRTGVRVCDREFLAELCPDDDLPEGPYVFAEITDEGVGFDEASREQLFNPFFTTKIEGRGLGLAAVQGIVQQHRGGIMFDSTKGEGSMFCVFLPILIPDRRQR